MDFVRRLVELGYLNSDAIDKVQAKRDPASHGIFVLQGSGLGGTAN